MPFFSVVIPLYNKENYIKDTLNSVINQSFTDFEVIIVNDGSTDSSLSKAKEISDKRFKIVNQENSGASKARNKGIELASSSYIVLLDADDTWYDNHLSELKKLIDLFPKAGLYCNNYELKFNKQITKAAIFNFNFTKIPLIVSDFFKSSIINTVAIIGSVAFTKNSFIKLGGFNSELEIAEDLDLWVRFALNYEIVFNPVITMSYNKHVKESLSKNEINSTRYNFVNYYKKDEIKNNSLKLYLDVNRYAIALRCKMNKEKELYKKLKSEINYKNLNLKQKILLNCPNYILYLIKKTQTYLLKNNIYLNAHN
ncbi:glycosyltransferase family A protein [Aestuariibaculum sp. YM273]|uniref:glycosyltransferase family 2 protein n=1 Tax=Aestuariibaculum sp. YM273 TaxID=3070659 RepID=UPI0027DE0F1B|nr:glycosyltransferase family A protein [Aestuariibaculum sp. YM273]WMI65925.1 glycosyltransferase family A protein [Aestuariibaculum sp. YM273]